MNRDMLYSPESSSARPPEPRRPGLVSYENTAHFIARRQSSSAVRAFFRFFDISAWRRCASPNWAYSRSCSSGGSWSMRDRKCSNFRLNVSSVTDNPPGFCDNGNQRGAGPFLSCRAKRVPPINIRHRRRASQKMPSKPGALMRRAAGVEVFSDPRLIAPRRLNAPERPPTAPRSPPTTRSEAALPRAVRPPRWPRVASRRRGCSTSGSVPSNATPT